MAPSKNTQMKGQMKQGTLSFVSKRTASTNSLNGKPSKSTRRKRPASVDAIIIHSDSEPSDEERPSPAPKKRRILSSEHETSSLVSKQEAADEPSAPTAVVERESLNLSSPRWRKLYGEARKEMGNIDPVHAKGQSMVHHILRVFDLSYQYGPCVGVSRLDRWERAHALGLDPPLEIKEILLTKEGSRDEQFSHSVFHGEI